MDLLKYMVVLFLILEALLSYVPNNSTGMFLLSPQLCQQLFLTFLITPFLTCEKWQYVFDLHFIDDECHWECSMYRLVTCITSLVYICTDICLFLLGFLSFSCKVVWILSIFFLTPYQIHNLQLYLLPLTRLPFHFSYGCLIYFI